MGAPLEINDERNEAQVKNCLKIVAGFKLINVSQVYNANDSNKFNPKSMLQF